MATAQLEKMMEFLTCTVCADTYTDPCTLMCQHSFCRICITKYTMTKPEALKTNIIPCPSCRQVTKVPDPSKPVEQWAAQIKPSIIILGLIDTSQADPSTTGSGKRCNACEKLGETTLAISWCPECEMALCDRCTKLHQVNPPSQDHEVCDLSAEVKVRRRKVMCREHKMNQVEFHCKDCKKSACQTCCILHHRGCKSVVTIESMIPEMKSDLHRKKEIVKKHLEKSSTHLRRNKISLNGATQMKLAVQSQIQSASKSAIDIIRQKEQELMDQLDRVTEPQMSQLQADVKSDEIEMQKYRQHSEFIDQALTSESVLDMYNVYQACQSGVLDLGGDGNINLEDTEHIADISFTQYADSIQHVLVDLQLGKIDVTYQNIRPSVSTQLEYDQISVRTSEDKKNPNLLDIERLVLNNVEIIIVTDQGNNCVKSFYAKCGHWSSSRLPLDNFPQSLSKLKENQLVVTVPSSQKIITVKVNPNVTLHSAMKTSIGYNSVVVLNAQSLAAGCNYLGKPSRIDTLDLSGQVMRSVSTHNQVKLFYSPYFMCVNNNGSILVSDDGKNTLTCLTQDGDVLWQYSPSGTRKLQLPRGITTDTEGNILLADREANKVILLTERGQFVKEVVTAKDGISKPNGIVCHQPGRLLLCGDNSLKEFTLT